MNVSFRYVRLYYLDIPRAKLAKLLADSEDPDQRPHSVMSDLGLHCLPVTILRVCRLKWVKAPIIAAVKGKLVNSADPDWITQNEAFDEGLHDLQLV